MKRLTAIGIAVIALIVAFGAVGASGMTNKEFPTEPTIKRLPVQLKPKPAMLVCAGAVHTAKYCAVSWHRQLIRDVRGQLRLERADKLLKPLKQRPVGFSLQRLKQSLRWHQKLLKQAKQAPKPSLYRQAAHYAVVIMHYPAKEWSCLAQIPGSEGGWKEAGVQFGHRHLELRAALRHPFGPWQANPGWKLVKYGRRVIDVLDIRTQVRWVIAYARKYGGGCGSLHFRQSHNYW